jgi:hypothetical protein
MATRIGFTGSRNGLTPEQGNALRALFQTFPEDCELHHGDCIGADASAHVAAQARGWRTISHPATGVPDLQAHMLADERRPPRPPLDRNLDIVEETDQLVACPRAEREEIRSGTWQTVRAARKRKRPITLVWPCGACELDAGPDATIRRTSAPGEGASP